jgi:hypothetical protein
MILIKIAAASFVAQPRTLEAYMSIEVDPNGDLENHPAFPDARWTESLPSNPSCGRSAILRWRL